MLLPLVLAAGVASVVLASLRRQPELISNQCVTTWE